MYELIPKVITYIFTLIIYLFILRIANLIYTDIKTMRRKKADAGKSRAYLKLLNIREELDFSINETYPISESTVIGRGKRCTLMIGDTFLSDKHAAVLVDDETIYLEDYGSTNGTFLNGERVTGDPIELRDGDHITMGRIKWIFVMAASGQL